MKFKAWVQRNKEDILNILLGEILVVMIGLTLIALKSKGRI
jgi:hypothetical protein